MKKIVVTTNAYGTLEDCLIDYTDETWAKVLEGIKPKDIFLK